MIDAGVSQEHGLQRSPGAPVQRRWEEPEPVVADSPEMGKLLRIVDKVASSPHPLLLVGESGSGKERIARLIHACGPVAASPFFVVDCSSSAPWIIARELFGETREPGPGGRAESGGLLCAEEGGTVYLHQIWSLPPELQTMLLRALQAREVRGLGSAEQRAVTVRVLAGSSREMQRLVDSGQFRKDLYYRLNMVKLQVPPLRLRHDDLPGLLRQIAKRIEERMGRPVVLADDALETIRGYEWPGNVRELEMAIERACLLSSGPVVHVGDLPTQLQEFQSQRKAAAFIERRRNPSSSALGMDQIVPIAEMERRMILTTIQHLQGDKLEAARLLGIGKTTLYRKLKEYGAAV